MSMTHKNKKKIVISVNLNVLTILIILFDILRFTYKIKVRRFILIAKPFLYTTNFLRGKATRLIRINQIFKFNDILFIT